MDDFTVLLVDDEEELVSTLVERLEIRSIRAEAVTSGEDALHRVLERDYDVVVLDIKMPGLGGMDLLRLIRRKRPTTQVILITGHGSEEGGEDSMREGAFDYVVKPVDIEVLVDKMRAAAKRARGLRES